MNILEELRTQIEIYRANNNDMIPDKIYISRTLFDMLFQQNEQLMSFKSDENRENFTVLGVKIVVIEPTDVVFNPWKISE